MALHSWLAPIYTSHLYSSPPIRTNSKFPSLSLHELFMFSLPTIISYPDPLLTSILLLNMASPPPSLRLNITNASTMAESSRQMHHGSVADSTVEPKELWNGKQREHNNNNQPADPESSRKQKVKSHLRRYRWWYLALVSTLVFFIIFLPVL